MSESGARGGVAVAEPERPSDREGTDRHERIEERAPRAPSRDLPRAAMIMIVEAMLVVTGFLLGVLIGITVYEHVHPRKVPHRSHTPAERAFFRDLHQQRAVEERARRAGRD